MVRQTSTQFEFGTTLVSPRRRELLHDCKQVDIGNRAFDLLLLLLEERGTVVSKDRIMEVVWPGRIIGENALEAQVSALRRALGDDRKAILTVAGRGYQFVGLLRDDSSSATPTDAAPTQFIRHRRGPQLPSYTSRWFGREADCRDIAGVLDKNRLLTLTGPGGVGKTRLAVETAHRFANKFSDGIYMVQVGTISTRDELPSLIASALVSHSPGDASCLQTQFERIDGKRILLLIDNCEHLLDAISETVELLLATTTSVHVLATSREPLLARQERTFRVAPLEVPPDENADDVSRYASVKLLLDRIDSGFDAADKHAMKAVAQICNSLDGVPLAIELSAGCVPALGVATVLQHLENRFELLTHGARTAPGRHKTLRASIDWSYERLSDSCRTVLDRLSVFENTFTLTDAQQTVSCSGISRLQVTSSIIDLVNKSLVTPIPQSNPLRYKLPNTMRAYATERLKENATEARREFKICRAERSQSPRSAAFETPLTTLQQ